MYVCRKFSIHEIINGWTKALHAITLFLAEHDVFALNGSLMSNFSHKFFMQFMKFEMLLGMVPNMVTDRRNGFWCFSMRQILRPPHTGDAVGIQIFFKYKQILRNR